MTELPTEWIKAVVLGHAAGDALGVPVEFFSREKLDGNPVTDMKGFGTFPVPAGCWSDDTSMTLCALDSLSEGRLDPDDIMRSFGRWYFENEYTPTGITFDVGNTCAVAINNYFVNHMDVSNCGCAGENSNGNGSLMRIIPFALYGFYYPESFGSIIETGSALTHAHKRSVIACNIYSNILLCLVDNPLESAVNNGIALSMETYGFDEEWKYYENLASIYEKDRKEIKSTGYVVDTLEAALWCLMTTGSYRECVLKAVNLGDDTDTVAAVAGGLAGALYGLDAIPKEWLSTLKRAEYIEKLCEKAGKTWNAEKIID